MTETGVTYFSGGGLAALGMAQAGVQLVGAVEYDAAIAGAYTANLGGHCTVAAVEDVDPRQWIGVDWFQASPSCKHASVANSGAGETDEDASAAAAVVRFLRVVKPRAFWLENVEGYARFTAYRTIRAALDDLGYWSHATVVNSADYGVAQTRRRLILRAVAGGLWQAFRPLPAPVPWVGWYAAIADLIPTLPESAFALWQLERLPHDLIASCLVDCNHRTDAPLTVRALDEPSFTVASTHMRRPANEPRAFLLNTSADKWGDGLRGAAQPAATIRTGQQHLPRAFLVDCNHRTGSDLTVRSEDEPCFTVAGSHMRRPANEPRAWLDQGRVVRMTPRALARFQSVPDSYQLPEKAALACMVIGNGVPVLLSRRITESLQEPATMDRAA